VGSSIDGLVSGLNTTQIIQQLMAVERLPEQQLTQSKTDSQNRASLLQSLNSLVSSLRTAATAFAPDSVLTKSAWVSTSATSSNSASVSAIADSTAVPGSATFTVTQIASAGSAVSSGSVSSTTTPVATGPITVSKGLDAVGFASIDGGLSQDSTHTFAVTAINGGANFSIVVDGQTNGAVTVPASTTGPLTLTGANGDAIAVTVGTLHEGTASTSSVSVGSGSLTDIAKAISASGVGVQATVVGVSSSAYKLQLSSTTTGSASDITINSGAFDKAPSLGNMVTLGAGSDTVLHVGPVNGGFDVTSPSTSVTSLLPGVTISVLKADPNTPVTVSVATDTAGIADKMKALVDAANAVNAFVGSKSGYDATSKASGPLAGLSMLRGLQQQIANAAMGSTTSTPSADGVMLERDGTISFDRAKFLDAYAKNPSAVQATMTTMAQALYDQSKAAADPVSGYITAQIKSQQDAVTRYTADIADFEDRMTLKQQGLERQFAALETALGQMQSQGQWLSGQLGQLSSGSASGN
jgi:flagellar hook-associated protein 2